MQLTQTIPLGVTRRARDILPRQTALGCTSDTLGRKQPARLRSLVQAMPNEQKKFFLAVMSMAARPSKSPWPVPTCKTPGMSLGPLMVMKLAMVRPHPMVEGNIRRTAPEQPIVTGRSLIGWTRVLVEEMVNVRTKE